MTRRVAKNLPFRGPTCPRCDELCPDNAVVCHDCGCRLVPDDETLARWMRVRANVHANAVLDGDAHADAIVADLARRRGAQPWPKKAA